MVDNMVDNIALKHIDGIPQSVRNTRHFCLWKYEERNGGKTKVPYRADGGRASTKNESGFSAFPDALAALRKSSEHFDGLGIGLFGDLVGIDIDHCTDADGGMSPLAAEVVEKIGSYTERSPSGTGVHILCRCPGLAYAADKYYQKQNGLEVYVAGHTRRFFTLTGDRLNGEELNDRTEEVAELLERYMRKKTPSSPVEISTEVTEADELDDAELTHKMLSGANGDTLARLLAGEWEDKYASQSDADMALCNYLAFWTRKNAARMDRLFRSSGLFREKWDEMRGGDTYGNITIARAIAGCTSVYDPRYAGGLTEGDMIKPALAFLKERDAVHCPRYRLDDIGGGYMLADFLKPFCRPTAKKDVWMIYDGMRWTKDRSAAVAEEAAKALGRALFSYTSEIDDEGKRVEYGNFAKRWSSRNARKTFIADASSVYQVKESAFDTDDWVLNCLNGTLDLRTRELSEHNPDDLITKLAPVEYIPGARCAEWEEFISEVMEAAPDDDKTPEQMSTERDEKAEFLQRYLGYCLTGETRSEAFMVLYGATSRNGKSVCVGTVQTLLGDYALSCSPDTVTVQGNGARDGRAPSENIARLAGVRLAAIAEIQQGTRLDASMVKTLTGGDVVNARYLGENSFDFRPRCKLLMHTNHLPACTDMSVFDSKRALVLPFERHFEDWEQDPKLKEKFRQPEKMSGILNWLLDGLTAWEKKGLFAPPAVVKATKEYRADGDKLQRFLDDETERDFNSTVPSSELYDAYRLWCAGEGQYAESNTVFKRNIESRGFKIVRERQRGGREVVVRGLRWSKDTLSDAS